MNIFKRAFSKVYYTYWSWKDQRSCKAHNDEWEFIWGIKSHDELRSSPASFYTMNDIDITYNKKTRKYHLNVETVYQFKNGKAGEKQYIKNLFDILTKHLNAWNVKTHELNVGINDVFATGKNINDGFDSIEELYAYFKCWAVGFIN